MRAWVGHGTACCSCIVQKRYQHTTATLWSQHASCANCDTAKLAVMDVLMFCMTEHGTPRGGLPGPQHFHAYVSIRRQMVLDRGARCRLRITGVHVNHGNGAFTTSHPSKIYMDGGEKQRERAAICTIVINQQMYNGLPLAMPVGLCHFDLRVQGPSVIHRQFCGIRRWWRSDKMIAHFQNVSHATTPRQRAIMF